MIQPLLLAAGLSRRFSTNKLLVRLPNGKPMALMAADSLRAAGLSPLAIVAADQPEVQTLFRDYAIDYCVCTNAAQGMAHSLVTGVQATYTASGWLIALADMPLVEPDTHRAVLMALQQGEYLVAPAYEGQRGHPVGIAGAFRDSLLTLQGDKGAHPLLQRYERHLRVLECQDAGCVYDIDTEVDLNYLFANQYLH